VQIGGEIYIQNETDSKQRDNSFEEETKNRVSHPVALERNPS